MLCTLILLSLSVPADEADIPTLFAGDEAWYKDAVSPLVIRDGVQFIPAELCSMFDHISVTTPHEDNLLIHNTDTGAYISILFSHQSAAVNGSIVENVPVFRDSGMFYVDAALVSEAVGLTPQTYESESGSITLRLSDENSIFTLDELISAYLPKKESSLEDSMLTDLPSEETYPSYDGKLKRIYVLCRTPENSSTPFPAQVNCELYGIHYTWFLDERNSTEDILTAYADGEYGVVLSPDTVLTEDTSAGALLDSLNESMSVYTRRRTRFTLSSGNDEKDTELREAGYIPVKPDFVVNGSSAPDTMLADIINYIGTFGSCTLLLEDYWNSERMVILLSELGNDLYRTANLSDYSFEKTNE